jgi:retron-type reverse transcriptase
MARRGTVIDADLFRYFDTIPHNELLKSVARRVADIGRDLAVGGTFPADLHPAPGIADAR